MKIKKRKARRNKMLKPKDIKNMTSEERKGKLKELKIELVKKSLAANKSSKVKAKEIKKAIARILTFNAQNKK